LSALSEPTKNSELAQGFLLYCVAMRVKSNLDMYTDVHNISLVDSLLFY